MPYEKKIRGKVFQKKPETQVMEKNELSDLGFDVEFDESINEVRKKNAALHSHTF